MYKRLDLDDTCVEYGFERTLYLNHRDHCTKGVSSLDKYYSTRVFNVLVP